MAMNPMQRKANNYLLIGVLVTLLITGTIIGILFFQLNKLQTDKKAEEKTMKKVYVVSADMKSGEAVSTSKLKQQTVTSSVIPSNAITIDSITEKTLAKIELKTGTILTSNMVYESDDKTTSDLRAQEYNMLVLPTQIQDGDYIDVRLRLPSGIDYIVVSKKSVELPKINDITSLNTIKIKMAEEEILTMSNAIVEAYLADGAVIYATTYVEPGMQDKSTPTYLPSADVVELIARDSNIVTEAANKLIERYNNNANIVRPKITNAINGSEEAQENLKESVQEEVTKAKEERQSYLESLGATY